MKNKKYYEISTINECVGKNDDVKIVQNIFLLVFAVLSHPRNNCAVAGWDFFYWMLSSWFKNHWYYFLNGILLKVTWTVIFIFKMIKYN